MLDVYYVGDVSVEVSEEGELEGEDRFVFPDPLIPLMMLRPFSRQIR